MNHVIPELVNHYCLPCHYQGARCVIDGSSEFLAMNYLSISASTVLFFNRFSSLSIARFMFKFKGVYHLDFFYYELWTDM